jgi:nicotinate-nucleotide adenylyltransferase
LGHLVAANEVASQLKLDSVIFVPAGDPWQKGQITASEHRFNMVQLAVAGNNRFRVSRVDVDRTGPSYSVDTLTDLACEHPEAEFYFIGGADAISGMDTWHEPERIWELAEVVAVTRAGHDFAAPAVSFGRITQVQIPELEISSTDIRSRISSGAPVRYLVPEAVEDYIRSNKLYLEGGSDE